MGIRRRLKACFIVSLSMLYYLCGCNDNKSKAEGSDKYNLVDYYYGDSCNFYKMIFFEGKCIFRAALSGTCSELTADEYVNNIDVFLIMHHESFRFPSGSFIRFEYYSSTGIDKKHVNQIMTLLKKMFNQEFILGECWEEGFELRVSNDGSTSVSK